MTENYSWLRRFLVGESQQLFVDHSHGEDKEVRSTPKASYFLCIITCTILRLPDSIHTTITCLCLKGQHHKRFRVTHATQVPGFFHEHGTHCSSPDSNSYCHRSQYNSHLPLILLVIQWPYKHDL